MYSLFRQSMACLQRFSSLVLEGSRSPMIWASASPTKLSITSVERCIIVTHHHQYSTHTTDMTFEDYRKLRKTLKARSRISGIPLAFIGMGVSSLINVQMNPRMFEMTPEEVQPIMGLDPIVFSGLCGAASAIVGYMLGGTIFTATWRTLSRKKAKQLDEREADFLERLQKHRYSEVSKYEDDYYGEKVRTLSDYRQWVRQQQKRKNDMAKFKQSETANS